MSAFHAIKRFRLHELNGLHNHIKRFGPLTTPNLESTSSEPSSSHTSNTSPTPPQTLPNPFLPRLNPITGRWVPPKYSLRRQAELIKAARKSGTVPLLPPGPKLTNPGQFLVTNSLSAPLNDIDNKGEDAHWSAPIIWDGVVKVKANAESTSRLYSGRKRMFKGHKWERTLDSRLKKRKILMGDMDKRIARFKQVCRALFVIQEECLYQFLFSIIVEGDRIPSSLPALQNHRSCHSRLMQRSGAANSWCSETGSSGIFATRSWQDTRSVFPPPPQGVYNDYTPQTVIIVFVSQYFFSLSFSPFPSVIRLME